MHGKCASVRLDVSALNKMSIFFEEIVMPSPCTVNLVRLRLGAELLYERLQAGQLDGFQVHEFGTSLNSLFKSCTWSAWCEPVCLCADRIFPCLLVKVVGNVGLWA